MKHSVHKALSSRSTQFTKQSVHETLSFWTPEAVQKTLKEDPRKDFVCVISLDSPTVLFEAVESNSLYFNQARSQSLAYGNTFEMDK